MIVVISTIECRNDSIDLMKKELCKLVPYTKKEFGCVAYTFYQDIKQHNFFHSYEVWVTQKDIDNHLKTRHIQQYLINTKPYTINFVIREMNMFC